MTGQAVSVTDLAHAVVTYYEGARAHAVGALMSNEQTVSAGMAMIRKAVGVIDASETGRAILIPFLTHADPMVRCEAAKSLHATHRDLATPVLLDLSLMDVTEASDTANIFLVLRGEPNDHGRALAAHCPHKYDDTLYREALQRLESNRFL